MKDKLKNRIRRKVFGVLFLLLCAVFLKPLSGVAAEETSFTEYDFIPWPWPKIGCVSQFLEYEWSLFDREKRFFSTTLVLRHGGSYESSSGVSVRDILLHERRINERIIKVGLSRIDPGGNLDPLKFLVLNFETEKTEIYKIQIGAWIKKNTSSGGDSISPGLNYPKLTKSFNGVNECKAEKIGLIVEQVDSTSGEVIKKRWGIRNVEVEF